MPITNTVWTYVDFIFNFSRFFWKFVTFAKFLLVLAKPSQPLFSCFFNDFFSLQILRMNSICPLNFNHLFNHLLDLFHFLKNELPPNHRLNLQNSPDLSLITIKPDSFLIVLFTNLFCIFQAFQDFMWRKYQFFLFLRLFYLAFLACQQIQTLLKINCTKFYFIAFTKYLYAFEELLDLVPLIVMQFLKK